MFAQAQGYLGELAAVPISPRFLEPVSGRPASTIKLGRTSALCLGFEYTGLHRGFCVLDAPTMMQLRPTIPGGVVRGWAQVTALRFDCEYELLWAGAQGAATTGRRGRTSRVRMHLRAGPYANTGPYSSPPRLQHGGQGVS